MWSKYKPVRLNRTSPLTYADFKDLHFGLSATSAGTAKAASALGWTYARPRGKTVTPLEFYRLSDFDKYSQNKIPTAYNEQKNISFNKTLYTTFDVAFTAYVEQTQDSAIIGIDELFDSMGVDNFYLAVLVEWTQGGVTQSAWKTADDTIANGATYVEFAKSEGEPFEDTSTVTSCNYYAAVCTVQKTTFDSNDVSGALFYPLPLDNATDGQGTITIQTGWAGITVDPWALKNTASGAITIPANDEDEYYKYVTDNHTDEDGNQLYWYPVQAYGDFYILFKLTNTLTTPITLPMVNIGIKFQPTLNSDAAETNWIGSKVYDCGATAGGSVTPTDISNGQLQLAAGASRFLLIGLPRLLSWKNGTIGQFTPEQGNYSTYFDLGRYYDANATNAYELGFTEPINFRVS
jgi:hypothetical protein